MKDVEVQKFADMHIHILPGVDDGAKNWEQSKMMLQIAYDEGIRLIVATPHFMPDKGTAKPQEVRDKVKKLQEYADSQNYGMRIYAGNEIYYYDEVLELLDAKEILTIADSEYVLIEFSPNDDFRYIRNTLSEIQTEGYTPILAHVERYESVFQPPFDRMRELKDMGILIQMNASTVEGKNGSKMKHEAARVLKERLIDFIGTDAHSAEHRAPMMRKCAKVICKKCDAQYAKMILYGNMQSIINKR